MPITERGRWTSTTLDERGRIVTGNLTEQGRAVIGVSTGGTTNGSAILQAVGTLTASGTATGTTTNGSATLQGVGSLTASGASTINGAASLQGVGTLTATGNMTITGSASLQGVGTLTANGGFPINGSATLQGVGTLNASGAIGTSIARLISLFGSAPAPIALLGERVASISLFGSSYAIALQGSKPTIIVLEGGLMTKLKQDFTLYAGDTPPFTITMADSTALTGATIKWAARKGNVKGAQVISKDTVSGLTVSGYVATIHLTSADTAALEGRFYHEMQVTDVSGLVSTVAIGEITILPSGV